jgi:hypothetical protein
MCHSGQLPRKVARCGTYSRSNTASLGDTESDDTILMRVSEVAIGHNSNRAPSPWARRLGPPDWQPTRRRPTPAALSDTEGDFLSPYLVTNAWTNPPKD